MHYRQMFYHSAIPPAFGKYLKVFVYLIFLESYSYFSKVSKVYKCSKLWLSKYSKIYTALALQLLLLLSRAKRWAGLTCLLQKHWGFTLEFLEPKQKAEWWRVPVTAALRKEMGWRQVDLWRSLANSLVQWLNSRLCERSCLKDWNWRALKVRHLTDLLNPHAGAHPCAHTLTNVYTTCPHPQIKTERKRSG